LNFHLEFLFAIASAISLLPGQAPAPPAPVPVARVPVLPGVRLTVLVDNLAGGGAVLGEWGAAILLESGRHRILFDTGGGLTLKGNAQALGINLRPLDAIVLSHGHSDHLGGLPFAVAEGKPRALFAHPLALETRYWKEASGLVPEPPPLTRSQLGQQGVRVVPTPEAAEVCPGLWVTGAIPRRTPFEETGVKGYAFLDAEGRQEDPLPDDQALFFRAPEGVVVVLGCGHAGVVNTLDQVCRLTGATAIHAVIGGTHLLGASPERLEQTVAAFRRLGVQRILLSHCTGPAAQAVFRTAFPGRCDWPGSGTRLAFGKPAD
jgi:7,8-dihydropterin-6-yl-methyl-4-(beta-D-ribofuranosyl)aminobenzene 5'-phosphate synthase